MGSATHAPGDAGAPSETPEERARLVALRDALLAWFARHRRDLPWRAPPGAWPDPWAVWVSEVMLQQTRVESVRPYFARFMVRHPTPAAFAAAPLNEVLAGWAGLGYYARARSLHAAATLVVARHGGAVPDDPVAFAALPGVGRYTCGAVQSLAFGRRLPALDGNVERALCRVDACGGDPRRPPLRDALWARAAAFADHPTPGVVNEALIELGATVCTPRAPACLTCPWSVPCRGRAAGDPTRLPEKAPRPPRPLVSVVAGLARDGAGAVWLVRNPPRGLLGGLLTLPLAEGATEEDAGPALAALGLTVVGPPVAEIEHGFTHKTWQITVWPCALPHNAAGSLHDPTGLADEALSGPTLKALRAVGVPLPHRRGAGRPD